MVHAEEALGRIVNVDIWPNFRSQKREFPILKRINFRINMDFP